MESVLKNTLKYGYREISEDQQRQLIDARSVFTAWEDARKQAAEVRGGMFWKQQFGKEYLIRTSLTNAQKSLGPRGTETEKIYENFSARKERVESRLSSLEAALDRHQRMNRALQVGRAPNLLVKLLDRLAKNGLAEYFTVVGTHALYAYEIAAGVRFHESALATLDIDLLWDTRRRVQFVTQMAMLDSSMLKVIRKIDPTFELKEGQRYTAVNNKGFEVDVIRREVVPGDPNSDPHPLPLTDNEDEFWAVQAPRAGLLLDGPRFSSMVVSVSGHMARMTTIAPSLFASFKRWLAERPDREPLKQSRDQLQAELVERFCEEYSMLFVTRPPYGSPQLERP